MIITNIFGVFPILIQVSAELFPCLILFKPMKVEPIWIHSRTHLSQVIQVYIGKVALFALWVHLKEIYLSFRFWSTHSMRYFHASMFSVYWSQFVPDLAEGIKHIDILVNF